jgi:glucose-6-phosphate dehydrogenase assembly protein OpcA
MENALAAQALGRARTATLVAVGPSDRLTDVSATLNAEDGAGALHVVRIITDGAGSPDGDERPDIVTIGGLRPEYVNNAIAGVRLSSLPTIVWWRGGRAEGLEGVASLADRVVLDAIDPWPLWSRLPPLFDQTAFTDVRWARLTRWRAALAHFFDLPRVKESAGALTSLSIAAADRAQAALFAGWLDASLNWRGRVRAAFVPSSVPFESVTLRGNTCELELSLLPDSNCLSAEGRIGGEVMASRVLSLGSQTLSSLMAEELRVRSRDLAFERALERALDPRS